ncbi:MAG: ATP-dependent nuclease [Ginsengibacter sp.]
MSNQQKLKDLIANIKQAVNNGIFDTNILYMRFPSYKNIAENTKIDFDFPLTVFIGPNGSGKSSTLHALYGAPEGYSTGNYWFSTNVDPIEEGEGNPNCFIYGYKKDDEVVEVLKTRVKRENPDNWEPSRPLKKYDMTIMEGKRNPAIKKDVVYLDFRSELSAFDKYFYFSPFRSTLRLKTKQDVIRKYSKSLKVAIDEDKVVLYGRRKNFKPEILSPSSIEYISRILSKDYSYCALIVHNFFVNEGLSVYFKTKGMNYSEAFAGRGEFAVVKIVTEILKAKGQSLIILDEPEVSLHPGAQEELKIFLLEQILKKKLQIIISTHSSKFAEFLPDSAIKLFYENNKGKFDVKNRCNPVEAFHAIGIDIYEKGKQVIIVEDNTAKILIEAIMKEMGKEFLLIFNVNFYPGGATEIFKKAASYSEENEVHKFLLLDGDKQKPIPDPSQFTQEQSEDLDFIKRMIFQITNTEFKNIGFRLNSNSNKEHKLQSALRYLKFLATNLNFFPKNYPEELIWNEEFAAASLKLINKDIEFTSHAKQNFIIFTEQYFGDKEATSYLSSLKLFINEFIRKKEEEYVRIEKIIRQFKRHAEEIQ